MGFNLTNEFIDQTFQQLVQISGSVLLNGTGSVITDLDFTGSHVESASHAEFADEAYSASNATNAQSSTTASYVAGGNVDGSVTSASFAGTANSSSHAEFSVTSSFALNFNPSATASYADYATSASYAISTSYADTVVSSSHALNADSASHAEFADQAQQASDLFITVRNTSGADIGKGLAVHATGVTGENVNIKLADSDIPGDMPAIGLTETAIANNGSGRVIINGRLIGVDTSLLVAGEPVYVNGAGTLSATKPTGSGLIQNIGTAAKINASDGEIILQGSGRSNDLPNITENYVWLGNSNQVPTAVASSSIIPTTANTASYVAAANVDGTVASATSASFATNSNNSNTATSASHAVQADNAITATSATTSTSASHAVRADISDNVDSSARLNVTDITASNATFTSASIGNLTTITGSATIIGDQYIILNSDAPTARFAGLKVYDSGSGLTGSFEWDSVDDNWIQVETGGESAGMLTGPSGSKGSETYPTLNTLIKGTGNHTVVDTNITDDGSLVKINSNTQITGSTNVTGSLINQGRFTNNNVALSTNSETDLFNFPGYTKATGVNAGNTYNVNHFMYNNYQSFGSGYYENSYIFEIFDSYGYNFGAELHIGGDILQMRLEPSGSGADGKEGMFKVIDLGNNAADVIVENSTDNGRLAIIAEQNGANIQFSGSVDSKNGITAPSFTGSLSGTATTASYVEPLTQNVQITGSLNITGSSRNASKMIGNLYQSFPSPGTNNTVSLMELSGTNTIGGKNYTNKNFFVADFTGFGNQFKDYFSIEYYDSFGYNYGSEMNVNGVVARLATIASGSGTNASRTSIIETRDVEDGSGQLRLFAGDNTIMKFQAGNKGIQVSGSVKSEINALSIASSTASLDVQDGDMFTLSLVSGSDIHLDASNIQAGQTINLKVLQPSTAADSYGTLSFAPEFKFAGGTAPTITAASGSTDILTFQSYDASSLFGTAVQNLS